MKLHTQFSRWHLAFLPLLNGSWVVGIPQYCNTEQLGNGFFEQLKSFADQHRCNRGKPRDISTRPGQAINQPSGNRIRNVNKNNRNSLGGVLGGDCSGRVRCDDQVNFKTDQLIGQGWQSVELALGISVLEKNVPPLNIAQFRKFSLE